ncbi:MAG TPA: CopD family protein [Gemmatimonadaceae bacterium]|nr:CopD family protein [Gemmatimonadaceae bacterium]
MQAEPLITWSEPVREYIGFAAQFLALGAVGFRFAAVRGRASTSPDPHARAVYTDALQRAAAIGLAGIVVQAGVFLLGLPSAANRAHTTVGQLLMSNVQTSTSAFFFAIAVVGLAAAATRRGAGWPVALVGVIVAPLTAMFIGQWARLVNPIHRVVAGLWIGTLFVLVVVGLNLILREERTRERRGAMAAELVNGFSPLALTCGAIVVASGLTTAWTHLNPLSSLWSTPYGYALIVKLTLVATVFGLGAWNWRRVRPTLGSEDAAHTIRRSAKAELTAAALVLAATAILVSLPSPKAPTAPPPAAIAP